MKTKWSELYKQVDAVGFGNAPAGVGRLVYACEIGDGINQHASEDIWAVIDEIETLKAENGRLREALEAIAEYNTSAALSSFVMQAIALDALKGGSA